MAHTIITAIKEVMNAHGAPMAPRDVYEAIVVAKLYEFHAETPLNIVRGQIRRHCQGLDLPSSSSTKHFGMTADGKYFPLATPARHRHVKQRTPRRESGETTTANDLRRIHERYVQSLRTQVMDRLGKLDGAAFERFSKRLLEAYGFEDMVVTRTSRDGGIDGHGKLKVGLAHLNVAFQSKRWKKGSTVGRPEIDQFRGATQGRYEQGILFTTSKFTAEAKGASFQNGAVPIILIDGAAIVDLMLAKGFGIQIETLPVYIYALDMVLESSVTTASSTGTLQ
jgi:restriction system protein